MLAKLPPSSVLVPPVPPLQRYKREVSVALEQGELAPGAKPGAKGGITFMYSSPPVERSPDYERIEALDVKVGCEASGLGPGGLGGWHGTAGLLRICV